MDCEAMARLAGCRQPKFNSNDPEHDLEHEDAVVWLEDALRLPYVRERLSLQPFRCRRPSWRGPSRLLGYTTVGEGARRGLFMRRVFWLEPHDPYSRDSNLWYPCEAVLPATIEPRVWGTMDTPLFWANYRSQLAPPSPDPEEAVQQK